MQYRLSIAPLGRYRYLFLRTTEDSALQQHKYLQTAKKKIKGKKKKKKLFFLIT